MASEGPSANPMIVEPSTPTKSTLLSPSSQPTSSPDLNTPTDSLGSSRPRSQNSSSTSISDQSSDIEFDHIPRSVPDNDLGELPAPVSSTGSTVSNTLQLPTSQESTSEPSPASQSENPVQGTSISQSDAGTRWLPIESLSQKSQASIGAISLALTIVGIWFCVRSYKMAVWTMQNDALQDCLNYLEANRNISQDCAERVEKGVPKPLYTLWARASNTSNAALAMGSKFIKRDFRKACSFGIRGCEPLQDKTSVIKNHTLAVSITISLLLGSLCLILIRQRNRKSEIFTSPARFDYQITRHHESGPEVVTGQATRFLRHRPDEDQYPGELRRSIELGEVEGDTEDRSAWYRYDSSMDTLVNPWAGRNPSKVSITNPSGDEKHEGLIELETTGGNKTFFDPETGEFIHITPWKSTQDGNDGSVNGDDKGSVNRAVPKIFSGAFALAAGKQVDAAVKTKSEETTKGTAIERWGGEMMQRRHRPHQAGDCVTGGATNETPSGRPQIA